MIRPATEEDLPSILEMGYEFFKQSGYSEVSNWSGTAAAQTVLNLINNLVPSVLLVAEEDNKVVGMAACVVVPFYLNTETKMAQELFWFISPEHRRSGIGSELLDGLEAGAKLKGADFIMLASIAGLRSKAIARIYERRGYRAAENTFIRKLT